MFSRSYLVLNLTSKKTKHHIHAPERPHFAAPSLNIQFRHPTLLLCVISASSILHLWLSEVHVVSPLWELNHAMW